VPGHSDVASGGHDGIIRIWNPHGTEAAEELRGRHTRWVQSLAASADGTRLYSASGDRSDGVFIWDLDAGTKLERILEMPPGMPAVAALVVTLDGALVVGGAARAPMRAASAPGVHRPANSSKARLADTMAESTALP